MRRGRAWTRRCLTRCPTWPSCTCCSIASGSSSTCRSITLPNPLNVANVQINHPSKPFKRCHVGTAVSNRMPIVAQPKKKPKQPKTLKLVLVKTCRSGSKRFARPIILSLRKKSKQRARGSRRRGRGGRRRRGHGPKNCKPGSCLRPRSYNCSVRYPTQNEIIHACAYFDSAGCSVSSARLLLY